MADYESCVQNGDFFIAHKNEYEPDYIRINFLCPCGCGSLCGVRVRKDGQKEPNCWAWDCNEDKPTVTPSIDINHGHWHGYLTGGIFRSC